jgi:hypothetical protein
MLLVVPALSGIGAAGASGATGRRDRHGGHGRTIRPGGRSRAAGGAASRRGRTRLAIAAACGVALLQYAGQRLTIASVLVALAALAVLWSSVPRLLPTGTLRAARGLPTTVLMRGLLAGAFFGAEAFVPLMLVQERQLGPGQAGLALTGAALGWSAGSWYQGRPQLPIPRHRLVQLGCWLVGVAIALTMVVVVMAVTPWVAALAWVVGGLGMGLAMASVGVLVLEQSPIADQGANSAALQVSDALLSTIMIGVGGALFAALHVRPGSDTPAFVAIYAVMLAVALLGAALATRVRTPLTRAPGDDTR